MASIREQILTAIIAAMATSGGVGGTVYRSRATPLARQEFPAVIVEPISDTPDDTVYPKTTWSMVVRIAILVKSETPDSAADTFLIEVHERMLADPNWGGLAINTMASVVNWELIEADVTTGVVSASYLVVYRTDQDDLTVQ